MAEQDNRKRAKVDGDGEIVAAVNAAAEAQDAENGISNGKESGAAPEPPATHLRPELVVEDFDKAVAWYTEVFDAKLTFKFEHEGKIIHSMVELGNGSAIYVVDATMDKDEFKPVKDVFEAETRPYQLITIALGVPDADLVYKKALAAGGAVVTLPIHDAFWGERYARFRDPFGHSWSISHRGKAK